MILFTYNLVERQQDNKYTAENFMLLHYFNCFEFI